MGSSIDIYEEAVVQDRIEMRGQLRLCLTDQAGRVVQERQYHNRIVTSGRMLVAEMFSGVTSGAPPTAVTHMAVGTGATDPTDDDKNLLEPRPLAPPGAAQRGARKPITVEEPEPFEEAVPGTGDKVKRVRVSLSAVFDYNEANGGEPLREAGVFTAEAGGVMYNRVVFEPVIKTSAFKLTLLWDIIF
jgi:hypothetical protein